MSAPLGEVGREVRRAARALARAPAFAAVATLTFALGTAGVLALFALVHAVLLRPLPYPHAARLVGLWHAIPGLGMEKASQSDASYLVYRRATRAFEELGAYALSEVSVTGRQEPERVRALAATATLAPTLGVRPMLGRALAESDDRPGAPAVVVLSHAYWTRRFGADRAAVGRTLDVDGVPHEIVGVLPPAVAFPDAEVALWVALRLDPRRADSGTFRLTGVARLRPGVTPDAAAAALRPLALRIPEDFPGLVTRAMLERIGYRPFVVPLRDDVVGDARPVLLLVLGTAALVLLIACANVANLFVVRGEARQRELGVRAALGASRGDLLRLALAESLLVAAAGAAIGTAVAALALRAAVRAMGSAMGSAIPRAEEVSLGGATLLVALACALAAGALFGAVPLLRPRGTSHSASLARALVDGGRGMTGGRARRRTRDALLTVQVALALVLLASAGLLGRSVAALRRVDPGFRADGVLAFGLSLPAARYATAADAARFHQQLLDRLRALPGVRAAGAVARLPLAPDRADRTRGVWIEDHPYPAGAVPTLYPVAQASPGYLETMAIPLVAGRAFERGDHERRTGAAVVSRAFAERYWAGGSALGKRIRPSARGEWYTIVGVAGDVRAASLAEPPEPTVYLPLVGLSASAAFTPRSMAVVVRGDEGRGASALAAAVRRAVREGDPALPVEELRPMRAVVAGAAARTAATALALGIAAAVALALGAVGTYGVVAYAVSLRTREFGIRVALGARGGAVRRLAVGQGVAAAAVGVVAGLAGAVAVARAYSALLYGVRPADPATLAGAALLLLATAALASWIPARRASAVDPVVALRAD